MAVKLQLTLVCLPTGLFHFCQTILAPLLYLAWHSHSSSLSQHANHQITVQIADEWKTNLMSLAILFHLLCAQHVSDINISIFRSLRLCWWITTSVVLFSARCVLEPLVWAVLVVFVLQPEACKTNTTKYTFPREDLVYDHMFHKCMLFPSFHQAHFVWSTLCNLCVSSLDVG